MNTSISWMNVFEFGGGVRGEGVLDDRDDGFADGAAKVGVADVRAVMNESMEDRVEERDDFRGGLLSSAGPSCFKPGFDVVCLAPVAMNDQGFLMRVITGRSQTRLQNVDAKVGGLRSCKEERKTRTVLSALPRIRLKRIAASQDGIPVQRQTVTMRGCRWVDHIVGMEVLEPAFTVSGHRATQTVANEFYQRRQISKQETRFVESATEMPWHTSAYMRLVENRFHAWLKIPCRSRSLRLVHMYV
jgi:hypothetical protein